MRFETRTRWTIPGIDQENVFPVSIQSAQWFLDAGRANPQLKVTRYQFPIAPDFADTFYGAQGSTIEPGVIVDMVGADPIAAYIGMTRCRTRQKILIYRPFPLAPFQEGLPLGRQLLLDVWKQEPVDWDALRKKYLDERPCQECGEMKRKDAFTKAQWKQETYRVCKECTAQKREAGTPYRCTQCGLWHAACHFGSKHQSPRWSMYRVCLSCVIKKKCSGCHKKLTQECFSRSAWQRNELSRKICLQCQNKTRGRWTCAACHQRVPIAHFSTFLQTRPSGEDGTQTCNACRARKAQRRIRHQAATAAIARLEPLRKSLSQKKIIRETWEAIAQRVNATETARDLGGVNVDEQTRSTLCTTPLSAPTATARPATALKQRMSYTCPFCSGTIASTILTGKIDHRHMCNNQFRVRDGQVTARRYQHPCPTCNAIIYSSQPTGRIRSLHKTPSGALCKQKDWIVKDDTEVSAVVAQAALQKRAAARSLSRLEPLHKKLRQTQVLRETWDAIAEHRKKWTSPALTCEEKTTNEVATGQKMDAVHSSTQPRAVGPDTAPPRLHIHLPVLCQVCTKPCGNRARRSPPR